MDIEIRGHSPDVTVALRAHVTRRLAFGLDRFERHVRRVHVRLSDVNGHHTGGGKQCHVEVELSPHGTVRVEHTEADIFAAATCAIRAASRAVAQALRSERRAPASERRSSVRGSAG